METADLLKTLSSQLGRCPKNNCEGRNWFGKRFLSRKKESFLIKLALAFCRQVHPPPLAPLLKPFISWEPAIKKIKALVSHVLCPTCCKLQRKKNLKNLFNCFCCERFSPPVLPICFVGSGLCRNWKLPHLKVEAWMEQ